MAECRFPLCRSSSGLPARFFGGLLLCLLLLTPAAVFLAATPAVAENPDLRHLLDRLGRMERDINLLQRQVYITGKQAAAKGEVKTASPPGADPSPRDLKKLAVRMETRFGEIEDEIRQITGHFEELTFKINQLDKRLDLLVSDIELRLDTLEKGATLARNQDVNAGLMGPAGDGRTEVTSVPPGESSFGDTTQVLGILKTPVGEEGETTLSGEGPAAAGQAGKEDKARELATLLPEGTPAEQYEHAKGLLWQSDYQGAERALRAFLQVHPDDELAGNAQYWLGETFYVRKDFTNAAVIFAEGYEKYPAGAKAPDNLLKLGLSLANIGENEQACRALGELERKFPDAPAGITNRAIKERKKIGCS